MKKKAVQWTGSAADVGARVLRVFSRYRAATRRLARDAVRRRMDAEGRGDPVGARDANEDHRDYCTRLQAAEELLADVFRAMVRGEK